jgi:hypothetical protein
MEYNGEIGGIGRKVEGSQEVCGNIEGFVGLSVVRIRREIS